MEILGLKNGITETKTSKDELKQCERVPGKMGPRQNQNERGEVASNRYVGRGLQTRADGGTGVTFKEIGGFQSWSRPQSQLRKVL